MKIKLIEVQTMKITEFDFAAREYWDRKLKYSNDMESDLLTPAVGTEPGCRDGKMARSVAETANSGKDRMDDT